MSTDNTLVSVTVISTHLFTGTGDKFALAYGQFADSSSSSIDLQILVSDYQIEYKISFLYNSQGFIYAF